MSNDVRVVITDEYPVTTLPGHSGNYATVPEEWNDASDWFLTRTPTFWERLRFGISREWQVILMGHWGGRVHTIEWKHVDTDELRRFRRGPTRFSRWRRVS